MRSKKQRDGTVVTSSLPRIHQLRAAGLPEPPHVTKDGRAVFRGQREIDAWMAKKGPGGVRPGDIYKYDRSENLGDE